MHVLKPRYRAALRYLRRSDPLYKWRISSSACPNCSGKFFLSMRPDAFMTRCLRCGANVTNLSLIPVIKLHNTDHQIACAYEMSTYGATLNFLKGNFREVITSEYFPNKKPGEIVNGILNQDVQNLTFKNCSVDLITSNQVFEHVPDDIAGYSECYRVLRLNGALIFSIPLYDIPSTEMLAEIKDNDIVFYREPEYHDSRSGGPKSALTFWHHSIHDICERVAQAGFNVSIIDIAIAPSQKIPAKVVYAVKTSSMAGGFATTASTLI